MPFCNPPFIWNQTERRLHSFSWPCCGFAGCHFSKSRWIKTLRLQFVVSVHKMWYLCHKCHNPSDSSVRPISFHEASSIGTAHFEPGLSWYLKYRVLSTTVANGNQKRMIPNVALALLSSNQKNWCCVSACLTSFIHISLFISQFSTDDCCSLKLS